MGEGAKGEDAFGVRQLIAAFAVFSHSAVTPEIYPRVAEPILFATKTQKGEREGIEESGRSLRCAAQFLRWRGGRQRKSGGTAQLLLGPGVDGKGESGRFHILPTHALAGAVAPESDKPSIVVPVEAFDSVVQATLRLNVPLRRERIVDAIRPALFLESRQNGNLIGGGDSVLLDHTPTHTQLPIRGVPVRRGR